MIHCRLPIANFVLGLWFLVLGLGDQLKAEDRRPKTKIGNR